VAGYLARFKGSSREHTESDLRCYLAWCAERGLDPLAARRPHLELYIRWMQEVRRFKPSTTARRFFVTAGFYRTCQRSAEPSEKTSALADDREFEERIAIPPVHTYKPSHDPTEMPPRTPWPR
jgi:site-specific recombinase XerD